MKKIIITASLSILSIAFYAQTNVNINFSYKLSDFSYCSFYKFYIDENTDKLEDELYSLNKQYKESNFFENEANKIQILSSIHFDWNKQKQTIVYYKEVKDSIENYHFFYTNTNYKDVLENVQNILILKEDAFWAFYNSENNSEYPEINNVKPLVKDADGVLNIFKLAKVIAENETLLNKYLEE